MKNELIIILSVLAVLIGVAVYKFIQFRKTHSEKKKNKKETRNSLLTMILPDTTPTIDHDHIQAGNPGLGHGGSFGGGGAAGSYNPNVPIPENISDIDTDGFFEELGEALGEIGSNVSL